MTRCVRIDYSGDFHIDVVPYVSRGGQTFITNRHEPKETGRWELSFPEKFAEWIDIRQRNTNQNFIKVVRLLKYLRDYKNTFTCKSVIFLTLLGERINESDLFSGTDLYPDIPTALVCIVERLANWLPTTMPAVLDPAGSGDNFSERYQDEWDYENFRTRIRFYATKMRAALDEENIDTSVEIWRGIFGEKFKSNYVTKSLTETRSIDELDFSSSIPTQGEQFINQAPYNFLIQLDPRITARIKGRCIGYVSPQSGYRKNGFRQYELSRNGNRVGKDRRLKFTLETNAKGEFAVYWKVRNGGQEAFNLSQLRGEITRDEGTLEKTETALYRGVHYVECYIVKDNVVIAKDRQNVVIEL